MSHLPITRRRSSQDVFFPAAKDPHPCRREPRQGCARDRPGRRKGAADRMSPAGTWRTCRGLPGLALRATPGRAESEERKPSFRGLLDTRGKGVGLVCPEPFQPLLMEIMETYLSIRCRDNYLDQRRIGSVLPGLIPLISARTLNTKPSCRLCQRQLSR